MKQPTFNSDGIDDVTFAPFVLEDCRHDTEPDVRLSLSDFEPFEEALSQAEISLELNGNELGDIVSSLIEDNGLVTHPDGTYKNGYFNNSEGDTLYFHFNHVSDAARVAEFCLKLLTDKTHLTAAFLPYPALTKKAPAAGPGDPSAAPERDLLKGIVKSPSHPDAITAEEARSLRERMRNSEGK